MSRTERLPSAMSLAHLLPRLLALRLAEPAAAHGLDDVARTRDAALDRGHFLPERRRADSCLLSRPGRFSDSAFGPQLRTEPTRAAVRHGNSQEPPPLGDGLRRHSEPRSQRRRGSARRPVCSGAVTESHRKSLPDPCRSSDSRRVLRPASYLKTPTQVFRRPSYAARPSRPAELAAYLREGRGVQASAIVRRSSRSNVPRKKVTRISRLFPWRAASFGVAEGPANPSRRSRRPRRLMWPRCRQI
jgi:hypothetical protein